MRFLRSSVFLSIVSVFVILTSAYSQQPAPTPFQTPTPGDKDEVIRIDTDLMQTDLMVFDKQGRFVSGLQREQFELKVDNKPQPISFLEQVKAGSASEEAQRAKAFGTSQPGVPVSSSPAAQRGRTVIFFIDDLHLSLSSLKQARNMIDRFINNEITPGIRSLLPAPAATSDFCSSSRAIKLCLEPPRPGSRIIRIIFARCRAKPRR